VLRSRAGTRIRARDRVRARTKVRAWSRTVTLSSTPRLDAVTPLPRPLTTPPLTMTYFITGRMLVRRRGLGHPSPALTALSSLDTATSMRLPPAMIDRPAFHAKEWTMRGETAAPEADCISMIMSGSPRSLASSEKKAASWSVSAKAYKRGFASFGELSCISTCNSCRVMSSEPPLGSVAASTMLLGLLRCQWSAHARKESPVDAAATGGGEAGLIAQRRRPPDR